MPFKWHFSDTLAVIVLLFLGFFAYVLLQQPQAGNAILLVILALGALRIIFEVTFNRQHVPTVGSSYTAGRAIIKMLQDHAHAQNIQALTIVDLGSGRGGLVRQIARALPQATVIGVERARLPHWQAQVAQRLFGPKNARFVLGDIFAYNCSTAHAVVIFLSDKLTNAVGVKLQNEWPTGGLLIASMFPVAGWHLQQEVVPPLNYRMPIRAYQT